MLLICIHTPNIVNWPNLGAFCCVICIYFEATVPKLQMFRVLSVYEGRLPQTTKKKCNKKYTYSRSSHQKLFCKNMFLGILQNSQENTSARVSFLIKLQASAFLVNFAKSLRTLFLTGHSCGCF